MTLVHVEAVRNTKNAMAKKLKLIITLAIVSLSNLAWSQSNVEVKVDERINEELRMKNAKIDTNALQGYRIQIFFGSDMKEAQAAMSSFRAKFPEYAKQVYQLYQQPSWKVRVGNFYREIEAQELLAKLREYYPDAFVVKDKIKLPPLPSSEESE